MDNLFQETLPKSITIINNYAYGLPTLYGLNLYKLYCR